MKTTASARSHSENTAAPYTATTNACKLCAPLGASLAFRGIEGAVPFLHGSQGCATYMRRYLISHFREPIDIASSSLGEKHAVYGGGPNLKQGIINVMRKYHPSIIGVATTCLTETIGDDPPMIIREFRKEATKFIGDEQLPLLVTVSTPSYSGTHMEGFHAAVRAVVDQLAESNEPNEDVAVFPGLVSPADLRYLKEILRDFGLSATVTPDGSESLDGPALRHYENVPHGGTPLAAIRRLGGARAGVEFGHTLEGKDTAGTLLRDRWGVELTRMGMPIGLRETDRLFDTLENLSGRPTPQLHEAERGRLVDSYVDGHKYVFGKRAVVYGEEDLVAGITGFLVEIGIKPVLCASGGHSGNLESTIKQVTAGLLDEPPLVLEGADFARIAREAEKIGPDLLIGHSKGYRVARSMNVPLIRVGFPIHDRFGGQRILHLGYRGTQSLFDRIVNGLLERFQETSPVGYGYL